ncbi:PSP1-domain-containing protein [Meredithblackwellia eburnea MCA 4105]
MTSPTSPQGEYGFGNTTSSFRATGNTPQSGFGGPSFALPPPSPPQPFFSPPLSPGGLSAGSNAFQGFPSPGLTSPTPQQGPQGSFFPSTSITSPQQVPGGPDLSNLGRGIPLHTVPTNAPLYIVEFKAGRKDLFFSEDPSLSLRPGDLVIVEADRGKDIGKLLKPCSVDEVQGFQQRLVEMALGQLANPGGGPPPNPAAIARMTKEFTPKKIFGKAQAVDTQLLLSKAQDEVKALALIRSKVLQKNLAMEVCDAEWQWDRRKLTFYYTSGNRVDFRELVRELFRLYKTRIWMCCLDINSEAAWNFST